MPETATHEGDVWPETWAWVPDRRNGLTVACGEGRCDQCPGTRRFDGEPWGPCTHRCHETPPTP